MVGIKYYDKEGNSSKIVKRINCKEDLIGTEHKCWRCNHISIITENGIDHQSNENGWHWECPTLQGLWEMHLWAEGWRRLERKLLYGIDEDKK